MKKSFLTICVIAVLTSCATQHNVGYTVHAKKAKKEQQNRTFSQFPD